MGATCCGMKKGKKKVAKKTVAKKIVAKKKKK
jgi:hypothetical protein